MSIYLSISKMCSSLFSRGNQTCSRFANAKRTTQSQGAALSAIYIERTRLTYELARWPWQPVCFFENNSEIRDICWGIMNTYFLILWLLPPGFEWNWCQNWRFILSTMCTNYRNFRVSTRPLRSFLVLFVTTFEQNHRFLRVHFEALITIFWTIWTIYYGTFSHFSKFRSKIKNMTCYLSEPGVEFEISTRFFCVNIFKNRSKFKKMKKKNQTNKQTKNLLDNLILFLKINESHFSNQTKFLLCCPSKTRRLPWLLMNF